MDGTDPKVGSSSPRPSEALPERPLMPRSRKALALCILGTLVLLAADLGSKSWALDELSLARSTVFPTVCEPDENGYMRAQRLTTRNGGCWSKTISSSVIRRTAALPLGSCGARPRGFGMRCSVRRRSPPAWRSSGCSPPAAGDVSSRGACPSFVSGALGNFSDRVRLGYVVDFIRVHWESNLPLLGTQWPTFNIADVTITVGIALLLIDGLQQGKEEKVRQAQESRLASNDKVETAGS